MVATGLHAIEPSAQPMMAMKKKPGPTILSAWNLAIKQAENTIGSNRFVASIAEPGRGPYLSHDDGQRCPRPGQDQGQLRGTVAIPADAVAEGRARAARAR